MSKLDPEVLAMRQAVRALEPLHPSERRRAVAYLAARYGGANGHTANEARMRECLRWLYGAGLMATRERDLITQALRDTK